jgi:site-specific recombinase XerC
MLLADGAASYERACRQRQLSPETVAIYRAELAKLDRYLTEHGMPKDVGLIRREHIESWLIDLSERYKPASVSMAFRSARTFFNWLVEDDELLVSPMRRMKAPLVPVDPPAIVGRGPDAEHAGHVPGQGLR